MNFLRLNALGAASYVCTSRADAAHAAGPENWRCGGGGRPPIDETTAGEEGPPIGGPAWRPPLADRGRHLALPEKLPQPGGRDVRFAQSIWPG